MADYPDINLPNGVADELTNTKLLDGSSTMYIKSATEKKKRINKIPVRFCEMSDEGFKAMKVYYGEVFKVAIKKEYKEDVDVSDIYDEFDAKLKEQLEEQKPAVEEKP